MGPSCGMWIPAGTLAKAGRVIEAMIQEIGQPDFVQSVEDFYATDTRPIGGELYGLPVPLFCAWEAFERDEDGERQVETAFGFRPEPGSYAIGSHAKSDNAHRMVAEVAAYLAEELGGVIDFCYPLKEAAELTGRKMELRYEAIGGSALRTVLDAKAMRAWSRHPRCWMVR